MKSVMVLYDTAASSRRFPVKEGWPAPDKFKEPSGQWWERYDTIHDLRAGEVRHLYRHDVGTDR